MPPMPEPIQVHGVPVFGLDVDSQTRCRHYHSPVDIIAIKFRCCGQFYPCHACHEALTDHAAEVWPVEEFGERAVLCGACGHLLTIREYLASAHRCPVCRAEFNPGCARHRHLYFAS